MGRVGVTITVDAHNYAPEPNGKAALIVPYFEDGRLHDLVACGLATRTCRTRVGICTALGADQIDLARETETAVRLYADPLEWLQQSRRGACVGDWRAARHVLADVPAVDFNDAKALADRINKAIRQPVHVPRLIVRQDSPAAPIAKRQPDTEAPAEWAAKTAEHKIGKAATETHPYLDSIGFAKMLGLVHEGLLLVPMRLDGRTGSLQEIAADGTAHTWPAAG